MFMGQRPTDYPAVGFWGDDYNIAPAFVDLTYGWHHFAFSYTMATRNRKVYVDGTLWGQDTSAALNAPNKPIIVRHIDACVV